MEAKIQVFTGLNNFENFDLTDEISFTFKGAVTNDPPQNLVVCSNGIQENENETQLLNW